MSRFLEALRKRGMLHAVSAGTEGRLLEGAVRAYIGFDPTAGSLHVGNLATIMLLKHLQLAGHKPVLVVGGATGMIGDPSGKRTERRFLSEEELRYNQARLQEQLATFLDFSGPRAACLLNNYDWYREQGVICFLKEVGKHIPTNYLLAKESIKQRLEEGLSYTEFSYALLQAYDFYYLYKNYGVELQMGGSDQWGNITTGIEFIRRKLGKAAYGLTTPLLTKSDGTKFGKTEKGNVWLDPSWTSSYEFYQFWLNCSDEEAPLLLKRMTLYSVEEIGAWEEAHRAAPHRRVLQEALARFVTTFVHGEQVYEKVRGTSEVLFGKAGVEALAALEEATLLEALSGVPQVAVDALRITKETSVAELLADFTGGVVFGSRRQAREVMGGGGLQLNKEKIMVDRPVEGLNWLCGRYLLVQKGKKHYYLFCRSSR